MDEQDSTTERDDNSQKLERLVEALTDSADGTEPSSTNAELVKVLLSERYSGSFPHPDVLRQFGLVIQDGAERAFALTEREQKHRHECDNLLIGSKIECKSREATDRRIIIIMAFTFLTLCLVGTLVAIMTGHPIGTIIGGSGALLGFGGTIAVVRRFWGGKHIDD